MIVVDGFSEDATRQIVRDYAARFSFVRLLDNPRKTQQIALNIGIKAARGECVIRLDTHCTLTPNYISECVRFLLSENADGVGGRIITLARENTLLGRSIATVMSVPFGVGNSRFRVAKNTAPKPEEADTIPYACYRRDLFSQVGLYNDTLAYSEDAEFHKRVKEQGRRILFIPSIFSYYHARSDIKSFAQHAFRNGLWALLPTLYVGRVVVSLRHLAPLLFVSAVLSLAALLLLEPLLFHLLKLIAVGYLLTNLFFSARAAFERRDPGLFFALPFVFAILHVSYGLGSLIGLLRVISGRFQGVKAVGSSRALPAVNLRHYGELPFVSVVIPCRNEKSFISRCLDSLIANDYPQDKMEILVVDGNSQDGTRALIGQYAQNYSFIRVLDNSNRAIQLALNKGINAARGEVIARVDAHSVYKYDYLSQCVKALYEYGADNVGGRWITVPRSDTLVGRAICLATSVVFGVGSAYYRLTRLDADRPVIDQPRWNISVPYFCCRREVFNRVGLFNEKLDYSEDLDFWLRLRKAGYKTLFMPTIECRYFMRTKWAEFLKHAFRNGLWVLLPLHWVPELSFSARHVTPLLFVLSLLVGSLAALAKNWGLVLLALILAPYFLGNLYYSIRLAVREKEPRYFFILPFIFLSLHLTYGIGSVVGLACLGLSRMPGLPNFIPRPQTS